uniref:Putative Type IV secretory pathway, VirD4 component n=1 Tax=mine drainage metagenome TaxID=410659 RepID=E6Q9Y8_9ZZZZ
MTVSGQNDPRFAKGSGFLELIGLGAVGGALAGYAAGWEAVGLWKTHGFLMPKTLFAAIHYIGILPHEYMIPLATGGVLGLVAGGVLGYRGGYIPSEIHIRGSQLTRRPQLMQRAILEASPPVNGENEGIRIHPKIQTTEALEASHLLIVGGSGAGKTTILWPMINQIIERGDKAIIFSFKGDFEQKIKGKFALLAPWDNRSAVWALGRDIRTRLDAEALANTLIPEPEKSDNPMWTNGARSLVTGIISDVQREHGEVWGFAELAKRCAEALADFKVLKEIITRENPVAASLISGGADSKTTTSFLANISAYLTHVVNLGVAADDLEDAARSKQWSVNGWISGKVPAIAILGFRPSAKSISEAWCASLIEQIVLKLEDLPDVPPEDRRIWLILDEVPRMGKIPSITEALEVLRSKGVRIALGCQGINQIEEKYSKTTARSWAMQTATKILGRIVEPEDQRWAASLIGERDLERYAASTNVQSGSGQGGGSSQGGSYQRVKEHTVLPSQFGQIVKVTKKGPRAILIVAGSEHAALLDWPFQSNPNRRGSREKHQARWVLPRYSRPIWGAVPPKVDIPATTAMSEAPKRRTDLPQQPQPQQMQPVSMPQATEQQPQPQADADTPDVGEAVADHMAGHALDMAIMPGAGLGFELVKILSELMAPTPGGAPVAPLPQPAPRPVGEPEEEQQQQEHEEEDEAEQ